MIPATSSARTLSEHQRLTGENVWKVEKSPGGQPLCRWCRSPVPAGRRTFCSNPDCVEQWRIRNSPGYARKLVFKRDKGVCVQCGCDTQDLVRQLEGYYGSLLAADAATYEARRERQNEFILALVTRGFDRHAISNRSLWQNDHIVEVVNGGGVCGLDNCQTLCVPCHKEKTRKLASDRAAQRRQSKGLV